MATTANKYAAGTKVSASKSLDDIKSTLRRFGATQFAQLEDDLVGRIALAFVTPDKGEGERRVRFTMFLPSPDDPTLKPQTDNQHTLGKSAQQRIAARHEQEINRKWRALAEGIKGKLIMVDEEIETLEQAFYAHIVTPNGTTIYEETRLAIAQAYKTGKMPELMPGISDRNDQSATRKTDADR